MSHSLVTERYQWSFRPLTSPLSFCAFLLVAFCAHVPLRLPPGAGGSLAPRGGGGVGRNRGLERVKDLVLFGAKLSIAQEKTVLRDPMCMIPPCAAVRLHPYTTCCSVGGGGGSL